MRAWQLAIGLWSIAVIGGFAVLLDYSRTAGAAVAAPALWPNASAIAPTPGSPALLMFVHPHCSCSHASLTELNHLLTRLRDTVKTQILFIRPPGAGADWMESELLTFAKTIPNATVGETSAEEAARFGATTSGSCVLYDRAGQLLFAGGITALRGHEGDSFGQERIVALVNTGEADRRDSPVFGCPLKHKGEP